MKSVAAALAFAALAAVQVPARAQDTPAAEELLARSRVANGAERRPDAERESWAVRTGGLSGTLETVRRGSDSLSVIALGPFHTERGVDRGQRWHQNDNGQTVLDRADPSLSERIVTQSVQRVRQPVDAWELSTTYGSGHVLRQYYDARTYLLVRTEKSLAGQTVHTSYDDFRSDARGRLRPWHYFGGDDRPGSEFDYRLIRDDAETEIAENELAVPRDRRPLVDFPAGADDVRLPARIENGRIYVRLTIAGRGLDFLLDSGASSLYIDEDVARSLRLATYGKGTRTVAGNFSTSRVIAPLVSVGPLAMRDVVMRTIPIARQESPDTRVVGLLGFDFLDAVGIKIDYEGGTVDALRPGALAPPNGAVPVDVRLGGQMPAARATLGDATGEDFILDTGSDLGLVVFQRFVRAHPDSVISLPDERLKLASGVGGSLAFRSIAPRRFVLGALAFDDAAAVEALSPDALGFDDKDGVVGADLLRRFTVFLDFASGRVYLAPATRAARASAPPRPASPFSFRRH